VPSGKDNYFFVVALSEEMVAVFFVHCFIMTKFNLEALPVSVEKELRIPQEKQLG